MLSMAVAWLPTLWMHVYIGAENDQNLRPFLKSECIIIIMHSFLNWSQLLAVFLHLMYVHYKTFIGFALRVSGQRLFIQDLGHLLWSLQSVRGLSIYNEERQTLSHYQCLFPSLTASSTKDIPDKNSLYSDTLQCNSIEYFITHIGAENGQNPRPFFSEECITEKRKTTYYTTKTIPIKLYTLLLYV